MDEDELLAEFIEYEADNDSANSTIDDDGGIGEDNKTDCPDRLFSQAIESCGKILLSEK